MGRIWTVLIALLGAFALAPRLGAQQREITVAGDDRSRAVQLARALVERGGYVLIARDTTLPPGFRAPAGLVVVDAVVRLEGVVVGGVAVLGGHLYLRPRSRVSGPIAVVGGGVYPSALAEHEEIAESRVSTTVAVRPDTSGGRGTDDYALAVELDPPPYPARFTFVPKPTPRYDRVNGATLSAGLRWRLTRDYDNPPTVDAWLSYRTARESFGGGVEVDVPLGGDLHLTGEASRAARTNDTWIRGATFNSVSAILFGRDYRDYFESDRARVVLERRPSVPLVAGETWLGPRIGGMVSRDRSLRERDVWALTGREGLRRDNPDIDEGTIVSALLGTAFRAVGRSSFFTGDVAVERGVGGVGDFAFTHVVGEGRWETTAFRTHELLVYFRGMGPVGSDGAPRQRRGILGGAGTLPTLEIGALRGDRLFFVSSTYSAPIPDVEVPFLGPPYLELTHATGTAWATGTPMPRWVQNMGVGLRSGLIRGRVVIDPEEPGDPVFAVELVIPGIQ